MQASRVAESLRETESFAKFVSKFGWVRLFTRLFSRFGRPGAQERKRPTCEKNAPSSLGGVGARLLPRQGDIGKDQLSGETAFSDPALTSQKPKPNAKEKQRPTMDRATGGHYSQAYCGRDECVIIDGVPIVPAT